MKNFLVTTLAIALLISIAAPLLQAQPQYRVQRMNEVYALTDIAIRPVDSVAINNRDRVTGRIVIDTPQGNISHAFVWDKALGVSVLDVPDGTSWARAGDISDEGLVVGSLGHPQFGTQAYFWKSSVSADAWKFIDDLEGKTPLATNGRIIAGMGEAAFVYDLKTGALNDLIIGGQIQPGLNQAVDVNADGIVVGTISVLFPDGTTRPRAFRWGPGFGPQRTLLNLLPMPRDAHWTEGVGINDKGDIVGFIFDPVDQSVAFWDGETGEFTDLGMAPNEFITTAKAINHKGIIVGWSPNDHPNGLDTPFVWIEGTFYNLNTLLNAPLPKGDVVYRAYDINDSGVILAELFQPYDTVRFEQVLLIPTRRQ